MGGSHNPSNAFATRWPSIISDPTHARGIIVRYPLLLNFTGVFVFLSTEITFGMVHHQSDTRCKVKL